MESFNVLDRNLEIEKSYVLEASAGTGKTFSIENLVARLILESSIEKPTLLENILTVTFTRAAARDLKIRIRSTLEKNLAILQKRSSSSPPDYLLACIEQGQEKMDSAKRRLEHALASFDQAQIYTIHGFCLRMLKQFVFESHFYFDPSAQEKNLQKQEIKKLINDFFNTEIHPHLFSTGQIHIILNEFKNKIESLQEALLKQIDKDLEILPTADFSSDLATFKILMHQLKYEHHLDADKLNQDFDKQKNSYKVLKNKKLDSIYSFFHLFNQTNWSENDFDFLIREGLLICEFLHPENQKKKIPQLALFYPDLFKILNEKLAPLVNCARSPEGIFSRMAFACRKRILSYLAEEEKYRENDLLKNMLKALENPLFASKVRGLYQAAIIDEFQDTDPIQWEIFQTLFVTKDASCKIYLVGDPKQSIYAFRQADIYTYLSATEKIEHHASLNTNYRSQPSLVKGLNALFQACPHLFALPAIESYLDYPPVKDSPKTKEVVFSDSSNSIHFFAAEISINRSNQSFPDEQSEENFYFPFIAQEVIRLHRNDKLKFSQFAVLVKDKFQAQRLASFLDRYHLPYTLQRQSLLTDSPAWESLKELLQAVLNPHKENDIKMALGGPILGWNYQQVKDLQDPFLYEKILAFFYRLKKKLTEEGFGSFFSFLMHSTEFKGQHTLAEQILQREKGYEFYDELCQISSLLMQDQIQNPGVPHRLLKILKDHCELEDEEAFKKFVDPTRDAISILTIHNSKGLEFDIVFAYGLIGRNKMTDLLIPQKKGNTQNLIPNYDQNSSTYQKHCQEVDAEKMRQLYVAMTRAKYRLYLPVALNSGKAPEIGCASPMELFLAHLGQNGCSYSELYQRITIEKGSSLQKFLNMHQEISYTRLNDVSFNLSKIPFEVFSLVPPQTVSIQCRQSFIQSFTSLSKQKKALLVYPAQNAPHVFNSLEKTPHSLPGGTQTGTLLHKILETLPVEEIQKITSSKELSSWIQPFIKNTEFSDWQEILCEIAFNAFKTPLGNGFCLSDINPYFLYRETQFLYPFEKEMAVEDLQWQEGFLKGVMDLIFYHDQRYYLVDWKSNWLGDSQNCYTPQTMNHAMHIHDYYFQARIYKEALKRYIKLVDGRPFEEIYGGCFYIFLRGFNPSLQFAPGFLRI